MSTAYPNQCQALIYGYSDVGTYPYRCRNLVKAARKVRGNVVHVCRVHARAKNVIGFQLTKGTPTP